MAWLRTVYTTKSIYGVLGTEIPLRAVGVNRFGMFCMNEHRIDVVRIAFMFSPETFNIL
ncbi:MAG: hypothetical protein ABSB78_10295 [Bacteroidota bacterium]